ncbi:DHH family phosphoesterase [Thermoproteota archaeon]
MNLLNKLRNFNNSLIVHHWDSDGICSAVLLKILLNKKEVNNLTPKIGQYMLSIEAINDLGTTFDSIIILDLCLTKDNIFELKRETGSEITIFDHHLQEKFSGINHVNPVSEGESTEKWPSTTWVIYKLLDLKLSLPIVLGVIGDKEEKIRENEEIYYEITNYLNHQGSNLEDILYIVELIDSNYRLMDASAVQSAVKEILMSGEDLQNLQRNKNWKKNLEQLRMEEKRIEGQTKLEKNGILLYKFSTKYDVISKLARDFVWRKRKRLVVLVNLPPNKDSAQIYCRGNSKLLNSKKLIELARKRGYSAGGKEDVVGIILPKKDEEIFINEIFDSFGWLK